MIYTPRTNELICDVEKYLREANLRNVKYDFRTHIDAEGKAWIYKDRMLYVHDFRNHVTKFLTLPASTGRIIGIANCGKRSVVLTEKAAYLTSSVMEDTPSFVHPYSGIFSVWSDFMRDEQ